MLSCVCCLSLGGTYCSAQMPPTALEQLGEQLLILPGCTHHFHCVGPHNEQNPACPHRMQHKSLGSWDKEASFNLVIVVKGVF